MITSQHIEEGISRAYVQAIAARAGVNTGSAHFDYGIDGTLCRVQIRNGRRIDSGFKIDYQLKASTNWKVEDDYIVYDLEAKTYNDLVSRSKEGRAVPLILILLCLPKNASEWLENSEDYLLVRKCCYWTMLDGALTTNVEKVRIRVPRAQLLTPDSLNMLLMQVERGSFL
jgi:hypothetical protein